MTSACAAVTTAAIVISLQSAIYTYDGWSGVIYFSEEVEHPARDIPRSLFGGVLTITAIYLLVNVGLLYVLPITDIAGKEFAAGEAANAIFGRHGDTIFRAIPGSIPPITNPPRGCRFHPRCARAFGPCPIDRPSEIALDDGRSVACHLYG